MFDRQRFISDLRHLATLDVPWKHRGNIDHPELGMDCVFSPRWAYEQQGLQLPAELEKEFESYHRPPDGQKMLATMRRWFQEITFEETQPSDLIVLFNRKNPCHMAIKLADDPIELAEAYESQDGSISRFLIRPLDPRRRIAACFRIPDFA